MAALLSAFLLTKRGRNIHFILVTLWRCTPPRTYESTDRFPDSIPFPPSLPCPRLKTHAIASETRVKASPHFWNRSFMATLHGSTNTEKCSLTLGVDAMSIIAVPESRITMRCTQAADYAFFQCLDHSGGWVIASVRRERSFTNKCDAGDEDSRPSRSSSSRQSSSLLVLARRICCDGCFPRRTGRPGYRPCYSGFHFSLCTV